jgi:biopolymer transport protein ExbB/TolQ
MSDTILLSIAASLVATLFALLVAIIGWLGNKFYSKLDEISKNLVSMAGELHTRINGIDRRLVRVETHNGIQRKNDE